MFAIGCLFLVILPLLGLFVGGAIAGMPGATWGTGIGFAVALLLCGVPAYALAKASRRKGRD